MSDTCCESCGTHESAANSPVSILREVRELKLVGLAGTLLVGGALASPLGFEEAPIWIYSLSLLAGASTFVPDSLRRVLSAKVGVDTLMTIGALGAVLLGHVGEAAMLAFLFSISEALEAFAMTRTRRGLKALLEVVPPTATVVRDGEELAIDPGELVLSDRLLLGPGERVATDGVIRSGRSSVDLSAITGESVPVELEPGDELLAGAINGGGVLELEVTATTHDNSLARIVRMVEEAQERKSQSQRMSERIARPLVPGIMIVALGIALGGSLLGTPSIWLLRSLVVLVAAAPCAFALSVPVTVIAAVGAASRRGILFKGGLALETLGLVDAVALDKTGTLTRNRPRVIEVIPTGDVDRSEVLNAAAALETRSEHPLARAILDAAPSSRRAEGVKAVPGFGLVGTLDGRDIRLGKPGFIEPGPVDREVARLRTSGVTVVLVEQENITIGVIAVRDELRPEATVAVGELRRLGVSKVLMLTGDNADTAKSIAKHAGIVDVRAELLPDGKARVVEELGRRQTIAMVGDGINDAPALATASCGIAMGAAGTDAALEAADVALMGDDLRHLPDALAHAKRAVRIMRQNLALSGLILLGLIPLAAVGALGLVQVVAIHELAEVVVIANGIRAGRMTRSVLMDLEPGRGIEPLTYSLRGTWH
ncbi:MAG: heavy metal translocating P-type ATPase [Actinomycetota bacterium]